MGYHRKFSVEEKVTEEYYPNIDILDLIEIVEPTAEDMKLIFSINNVGDYKLVNDWYITRTL